MQCNLGGKSKKGHGRWLLYTSYTYKCSYRYMHQGGRHHQILRPCPSGLGIFSKASAACPLQQSMRCLLQVRKYCKYSEFISTLFLPVASHPHLTTSSLGQKQKQQHKKNQQPPGQSLRLGRRGGYDAGWSAVIEIPGLEKHLQASLASIAPNICYIISRHSSSFQLLGLPSSTQRYLANLSS